MNKPKVMPIAIVYKADGETKNVEPKNGIRFMLEELQEYVGGYIELVHLMEPKYYLLVNEDGLLRGLPLNKAASVIAGRRIVGDAVYMEKRFFK
jgi:hypothetical protein